jgi:hypothetical protein
LKPQSCIISVPKRIVPLSESPPVSRPWSCLSSISRSPLLLSLSCAIPFRRQRAVLYSAELLRPATRQPQSPISEDRHQNILRNTFKMFSRRLAKSSSSLNASSPLTRALSTSAPLFRAPALADITPEGVTSFDAKQKEFRARVAAQTKKKVELSKSLQSPSHSHCPVRGQCEPDPI